MITVITVIMMHDDDDDDDASLRTFVSLSIPKLVLLLGSLLPEAPTRAMSSEEDRKMSPADASVLTGLSPHEKEVHADRGRVLSIRWFLGVLFRVIIVIGAGLLDAWTGLSNPCDDSTGCAGLARVVSVSRRPTPGLGPGPTHH
jgi:hypothetical protein